MAGKMSAFADQPMAKQGGRRLVGLAAGRSPLELVAVVAVVTGAGAAAFVDRVASAPVAQEAD